MYIFKVGQWCNAGHIQFTSNVVLHVGIFVVRKALQQLGRERECIVFRCPQQYICLRAVGDMRVSDGLWLALALLAGTEVKFPRYSSKPALSHS